MKEKTIRQEYFLWLYQQIDDRKTSYRKLCDLLSQKLFSWSVPNDDNRCSDGVYLRQIFIDENGYDPKHTEVSYFLLASCNVFEVFVALSQRMEFLTDQKNSKWFTRLISNLELESYTDGYITSRRIDNGFEGGIHRILERFMTRTYDHYGVGSLFPLKRKPLKDMAKVEIWYQLMLWLEENNL